MGREVNLAPSLGFPMRKKQIQKYVMHSVDALYAPPAFVKRVAPRRQLEQLKGGDWKTPQETKSFNVKDFCIWTAV